LSAVRLTRGRTIKTGAVRAYVEILEQVDLRLASKRSQPIAALDAAQTRAGKARQGRRETDHYFPKLRFRYASQLDLLDSDRLPVRKVERPFKWTHRKRRIVSSRQVNRF
jgi:hypothetical protein